MNIEKMKELGITWLSPSFNQKIEPNKIFVTFQIEKYEGMFFNITITSFSELEEKTTAEIARFKTHLLNFLLNF
jgi:hypothetical protein